MLKPAMTQFICVFVEKLKPNFVTQIGMDCLVTRKD